MSTTFFNRVSHCLTGPDTIQPVSRPVFKAELGKVFKALRLGRRLGLRQAAQAAERKGLVGISRSALNSLEAGKTKNVDEPLLRALATLYGIRYETIVALYVQMRYGVAVSVGGVPLTVADLQPPPPLLDGAYGARFVSLWNQLDEELRQTLVKTAARFVVSKGGALPPEDDSRSGTAEGGPWPPRSP